jgi:zinc/manganese transport system substrate-binding protein
MTGHIKGALASCLVLLGLVLGCRSGEKPQQTERTTIVVTYSVLGAAVREFAGEAFEVKVLIPDGVDLHAWEPSAKDIETLSRADLIVENGLGLEHGITKAVAQARKHGVKVFTVASHVPIRNVGEGELPEADHHEESGKPAHGDEAHHEEEGHQRANGHEAGAKDPHFWTDPLSIKLAMAALATQIQKDFQQDLGVKSADMGKRLDALDAEIRARVQSIPEARRKLVTGHESLGYFAQRYGLKLVGTVIPGVSSEAQSSAAHMGELKALIKKEHVAVIFTEVGTPERTVEALSREAKVRVALLSTHRLPADGSYFTFVRTLSDEILKGLQ